MEKPTGKRAFFIDSQQLCPNRSLASIQPSIASHPNSSYLTVCPRGREGDELEDYDYTMTNPRRRSNSMTAHNMKDFKTKFETIDAEPVFEEELHGPRPEDYTDLEKMSTGDSSNTEGSIQEEDSAHNKKA